MPQALLKTAAASSPPADFVSTMTMFTVIGRDAQTTMPLARPRDRAFMLRRSDETHQMPTGSTPRLKSCTNALNR